MRHQISLRSRLARYATRLTVRPVTGLLPSGEGGVRLGRRIVATGLAMFGPPAPGTFLRVDAPLGDLRVRGEWRYGPGHSAPADAVIFYIHGSGYAVASARTHRGLTSRLAAMSGVPVFACDYRLAPKHRFPCAADDVRAAYEWLLGQGYAADRIVVAGDSAGGHLALDLALQLDREGAPGPAALVLFSPLAGLRLHRAHARDPMISTARAQRLLDLYAGTADATSHRLELAAAEGAVLPPTLIQAGGAEMLADDARHLAKLVADTGAACELEIWPGQMHVFQALPLLVPEASIALGRAAAFIGAELARARPAPRALRASLAERRPPRAAGADTTGEVAS